MKIRIKHTVYIALLIILAASLFACVPTRNVVIDIPHAAKKELPPEIQSLTLVTQAVDGKYNDLPSDSLQKIFYKKGFKTDTIIYDAQMADTTLKALGELLFESGRYDYVIPENRFLKASPVSGPAPELNWSYVASLSDTFKTDAVLSLDYLRIRLITNFSNNSNFDVYQGMSYSAVNASMQISYEALFRIYDPKQKRIVLREFMRDTLYWEDADIKVQSLFSRFTPVKQALTETGIAIALDLSERIAVRWRPERRRYFTTGNSRIKQGDQSAIAGDWGAAIAHWEKAVEKSGSKAKKSKALYNLALGFEILGDINLAIDTALESYDTMYRPLTYEYLQTLKRRRNELNAKE